jgi:hypothetical protein
MCFGLQICGDAGHLNKNFQFIDRKVFKIKTLRGGKGKGGVQLIYF